MPHNDREQALRTARSLLDLGHDLAAILENPFIPVEHREYVSRQITHDESIVLTPARTIVEKETGGDWTKDEDRSNWHYWPVLRSYLLNKKGWKISAIRSLDDSSDRVLRQLEQPDQESFDVKGLVLGYVQSGKTANYTAVISKAADAGYRFIIVLAGIDNGLRLQTNRRLWRELVGDDEDETAVELPPLGKRWLEFTKCSLDGDFQSGNASPAALQGEYPVLIVLKKNGAVLRRLLDWLRRAPEDQLGSLAALIIDDEADQASIDTRGTPQDADNLLDEEDEAPDEDYEAPSVINGLIRQLISRFSRCSYIAYTATPFANILIPYNAYDPTFRNDLFPKTFIVDLPKQDGYVGLEEYFGRTSEDGTNIPGLDVHEEVSVDDLDLIRNGQLPESLRAAIDDFVLGGSAKIVRDGEGKPCTMLVHMSHRTIDQKDLKRIVEEYFYELRDEWRYQRQGGIRERLESRWDQKFRPRTRKLNMGLDASYGELEESITRLFESVEVREVNSTTEDILDYDLEPSLKVIVVGGNKLSRGLTLEGLVVSYFVRRSITYDTLIQMGRWFGYRESYKDLTRIYTTSELHDWFHDLAGIESSLREDIEIYERMKLTPSEVGTRICQHPSLQVTSPLKRRFAQNTQISQSYSLALAQTFKFPFDRPDELHEQLMSNHRNVRGLIGGLDPGSRQDGTFGPLWTDVNSDYVRAFLNEFKVDPLCSGLSIPLLEAYIEKCVESEELTRWTVAVRGRNETDDSLKTADWNAPTGPVNQLERSRLKGTNSIGVLTSPGDEKIGLSESEVERYDEELEAARRDHRRLTKNLAARYARSSDHGLLLIYPISRFSSSDEERRVPLYENPESPESLDLIGLALSFPNSRLNHSFGAYWTNTAGWNPIR